MPSRSPRSRRSDPVGRGSGSPSQVGVGVLTAQHFHPSIVLEVTGELWRSEAQAEKSATRHKRYAGSCVVSEVMKLSGDDYDQECFGFVVWTPKLSES